MHSTKIISFYTPDWDYPKYAKSLAEDCQRLGMEYLITEKPSTKSYVDNCNLKPFFIQECIIRHQGPVLWVDVDTTIRRLPDELDGDIYQYDLAGYRNQRFPDRVYVNSIWFNYTESSLNLIQKWCDSVAGSIDDNAFNLSLGAIREEIKILFLPDHQHRTLGWHYHPVPDEDCFFVHRLSSSSLKWEYKNKVERR